MTKRNPGKVLNVGGGDRRISIPSHYENWQRLLLDVDPQADPDILCDAQDLTRLDAGEYDAVYCSHTLEHVYQHEVPRVLEGFRHVLKENGFAEIVVPNLLAAMESAVQSDLDVDVFLYQSPGGPITARDIVYGYGPYVERHAAAMTHRTGFTPRSLTLTLHECGFPHVFLYPPLGIAQYEIRALAFKAQPTAYHQALLNLSSLHLQTPPATDSKPRLSPSQIRDLARQARQALKAGQAQQAADLYQRILQAQPAHVGALINLGTLLYQQGDRPAAIQCYRQAVANKPDSFQAQYNLALALHAQGQPSEAVAHYQQALQIEPDNVQVLNDLGWVLCECGEFQEARRHYRRALQVDPDSATAHNNLGAILKIEKKDDLALHHYRRAVEIQPDNLVAQRNIGVLLEEQCRMDEAREAYQKALAIRDDPLLRLHSEILVSPVAASNEAIDAYRADLDRILARYEPLDLRVDLDQLQASHYEPPIAWGYQGRPDRALKTRYARLFQDASPKEMHAPAPGSGEARPHVGFVVTPGHERVFMRCMRGIVNHLPAERVRVTMVCDRMSEPILRSGLTNPAVQFLRLHARLRFDRILPQIRAARFDVLYHWETNTDSTNYFLPFFRLAPVQCTGWGWPATSAAPEMDYYLTSAAIATPESDEQFTETLVRLPSLPSYFTPPPIPGTPPPRARFDLPAGRHLYLCVQNLRKVHPDHDPLLAAILRGDPQGLLVLVADKCPRVTELLQQRWQRTLPDLVERIRILPYLEADDYFGLLALTDVTLDTLYYGGAITTYDVLAAGTPLVTLPGPFLRGRFAYAAYQAMGIQDCIADSPQAYVDLALRLGTDAAYRGQIRDQIKTAAPVLFENQAAVDELADWIARVTESARGL